MISPAQIKLTLAATEWLITNDRDLNLINSWDVSKDNFPPVDAPDAVYKATVPPAIALLKLPRGYELQAMIKAFSRDVDAAWIFTSGLNKTEIWLVNVKRLIPRPT